MICGYCPAKGCSTVIRVIGVCALLTPLAIGIISKITPLFPPAITDGILFNSLLFLNVTLIGVIICCCC